MRKRNPYLRVLLDVADAHAVPIVDTFILLAEQRAVWLFYDFILPNQEGHRLIAEAIYAQLFSEVGRSVAQPGPSESVAAPLAHLPG